MSKLTPVRTIKSLPTPKGQFLVGHLRQFNVPNKHQVLERWVEDCGDLFRLNFVGKTILVSANPGLNDQILRARPIQFRRFHKITEILEEMGVLGVFNAEGETWERHRKPSADSLNLKKIRSFYPIIASKTQNLIQKWQKLAENEESLDVQKEFMKYTVDITTAIAFGYSLDTINDKTDRFQSQLELIFPMINERVTAAIPIWRLIKRKKDKALDRAISEIEAVIYRLIGEAKLRLEKNPELKENPQNFLESLLVEQEMENKFTDKEIYSNVFTLLLAGEDTTSNSISWAIFYLAQHPEMVKKVRDEAFEIYGDFITPLNDQDIKELKWADAVAQETIRLKPVSPNLYMEANETTTLENLLIPKGTVVMMQNKVAQTREAHFTNASQFIPERWMRGGCPMHTNHNPEMIKAFGGGLRYCPGKNLAMHEMITSISALCKAFNFELATSVAEITEGFSFTMFPENLRVKVTPFQKK